MAILNIENTHEIYRPIFSDDYRKKYWFTLLVSPRGSMKTTHIVKRIVAELMYNRGARVVIFRQNLNAIKDSILDDIKDYIYECCNYNHNFNIAFNSMYEIQEFQIVKKTQIGKNKVSNSVVFFRGIKTMTKDSKSNNKGLSRVTLAVFEEAEDITDQITFDTTIDTLRGEGITIFFIMNVPDIEHFIIQRHFFYSPVKDSKYAGCNLYNLQFDESQKKQGINFIYATYQDNPWLNDLTKFRWENRLKNAKTIEDLIYTANAYLGYAKSGESQMYFSDYITIAEHSMKYQRELIKTDKKGLGKANFYLLPEEGCIYYAGLDVASGKTAGDFTSLNIFKFTTGEQVCNYSDRIQEGKALPIIFTLLKMYNLSYINVELNRTGEFLQSELMKLGYPRNKIYYSLPSKESRKKGSTARTFGTNTTSSNRMNNLALLRKLLSEKSMLINDKKSLHELKHFTWNDTSGKYEGQDFDDEVMSLCMSALCRSFVIRQLT